MCVCVFSLSGSGFCLGFQGLGLMSQDLGLVRCPDLGLGSVEMRFLRKARSLNPEL